MILVRQVDAERIEQPGPTGRGQSDRTAAAPPAGRYFLLREADRSIDLADPPRRRGSCNAATGRRPNEKAAAVSRGGFCRSVIVKRFPSLAGLAATYSSKS
jgi:hypothetical protein